MNQPNPSPRLSRRTILKWFAAAAAVQACAKTSDPSEVQAPSKEYPLPASAGTGYGYDPKITPTYDPGAFWPLTLTVEQRLAATALADLILPADQFGPAASSVRVPDFIDEWVSAPYAFQLADRAIILPGLDWLDAYAQTRHALPFAKLDLDKQRGIADQICDRATAKLSLGTGAIFFALFRSLAASAYYATEPGWAAIGYVGNLPLPAFPGPPASVLAKLGVTQTVL